MILNFYVIIEYVIAKFWSVTKLHRKQVWFRFASQNSEINIENQTVLTTNHERFS